MWLRLRSRAVALLLLLAACRQGAVAGTGAPCRQDDQCRAGYQCTSGACRAATLEQDALPPEAGAPDRSAASPVPPDAADGAGPDVALDRADTSLDAPAGPLSLTHCTEYLPMGELTECNGAHGATALFGFAGFSPDSRTLVAWAEGGRLGVWNLLGPTLSLWGVKGGASYNVVFSPDSRLFSVDTPTLSFRAAAAGTAELTIPPPAGDHPRVVGFSADGERVAILSGTSTRVWSVPRQEASDLAQGGSLFLSREPMVEAGGHWWLAYGNAIFAAGGGTPPDYRILLVDLAAPTPRPLEIARPVYHPREPPRIALGPDGNTLALADAEGVGLWDITDKSAPRRLPPVIRPPEPSLTDDVADLNFSATGKYLVVGVGQDSSRKGQVVIYEVASRQMVASRSLPAPAHRVAISPDERSVAVSLLFCGTVLFCHD
jgi:WD40 repeat protein